MATLTIRDLDEGGKARGRRGRPVSITDAQIAAIAASRRSPLATRNTADFAHIGLDLVNPWQIKDAD